MYRHGDLLLRPVSEFTGKRVVQKFTEGNSAVLLAGEATGHAHKIVGDFKLFANENGDGFLRLFKPSKLIHEEHADINLPAGDYAIIRQREYTPKGIEYVRD